jgi:hypothetical protein
VSVRWQPQLSGPGNFEGGICCQPYRKLHGGQNAVLIAPVRQLLPIHRCVGVSKSPFATTYFASTTILETASIILASPHLLHRVRYDHTERCDACSVLLKINLTLRSCPIVHHLALSNSLSLTRFLCCSGSLSPSALQVIAELSNRLIHKGCGGSTLRPGRRASDMAGSPYAHTIAILSRFSPAHLSIRAACLLRPPTLQRTYTSFVHEFGAAGPPLFLRAASPPPPGPPRPCMRRHRRIVTGLLV